MRISVVFTGPVMLVICIDRSQVLYPLVDVLEQPVFPVVDEDAGGDVHGGNENEALAQAAFLQELLNFFGDTNVLSVFLRFKPEIFGVRTQSF